MTKDKIWKAIEAYRMAGGREEHWRLREQLDIALDDLIDERDAARALAQGRLEQIESDRKQHLDYRDMVEGRFNAGVER